MKNILMLTLLVLSYYETSFADSSERVKQVLKCSFENESFQQTQVELLDLDDPRASNGGIVLNIPTNRKLMFPNSKIKIFINDQKRERGTNQLTELKIQLPGQETAKTFTMATPLSLSEFKESGYRCWSELRPASEVENLNIVAQVTAINSILSPKHEIPAEMRYSSAKLQYEDSSAARLERWAYLLDLNKTTNTQVEWLGPSPTRPGKGSQ